MYKQRTWCAMGIQIAHTVGSDHTRNESAQAPLLGVQLVPNCVAAGVVEEASDANGLPEVPQNIRAQTRSHEDVAHECSFRVNPFL